MAKLGKDFFGASHRLPRVVKFCQQLQMCMCIWKRYGRRRRRSQCQACHRGLNAAPFWLKLLDCSNNRHEQLTMFLVLYVAFRENLRASPNFSTKTSGRTQNSIFVLGNKHCSMQIAEISMHLRSVRFREDARHYVTPSLPQPEL